MVFLCVRVRGGLTLLRPVLLAELLVVGVVVVLVAAAAVRVVVLVRARVAPDDPDDQDDIHAREALEDLGHCLSSLLVKGIWVSLFLL